MGGKMEKDYVTRRQASKAMIGHVKNAITRQTRHASIPNAPSPMVRDALVLLLLQALHRIIQKEVDQDRIDAICLMWLFDIFDALVLVVVLDGFGNALFASRFDFWVAFLDFPFD
jgi:hypothetical protein